MVLFLKALKDLDAIQAALSNYLITLSAVAGGVLVLGGTLLITVWEELRPRATRAGSPLEPAPDPRT